MEIRWGKKRREAHHLEFKLYEPQQYTLLLPAAHCDVLDARPQPKSAPDDTATKEAFGGRVTGGKVAKTVRVEEAGIDWG